jgi:hypothetical protein
MQQFAMMLVERWNDAPLPADEGDVDPPQSYVTRLPQVLLIGRGRFLSAVLQHPARRLHVSITAPELKAVFPLSGQLRLAARVVAPALFCLCILGPRLPPRSCRHGIINDS